MTPLVFILSCISSAMMGLAIGVFIGTSHRFYDPFARYWSKDYARMRAAIQMRSKISNYLCSPAGYRQFGSKGIEYGMGVTSLCILRKLRRNKAPLDLYPIGMRRQLFELLYPTNGNDLAKWLRVYNRDILKAYYLQRKAKLALLGI